MKNILKLQFKKLSGFSGIGKLHAIHLLEFYKFYLSF